MFVDVRFLTSRLIKRLLCKLLSMAKLGKLFDYRLTVAVLIRGSTGICSCGRREKEVKDQDLRGLYRSSSFLSSENFCRDVQSRVPRYQIPGSVKLRKVAGPKVRRLTQFE